MSICLDPGHGYSSRRPGVYDSGAVAAGIAEADVVLQWALTAKWLLSQAGIPVVMTRDDDRDSTPVGQRDEIAERLGADLFLSLHCNAANGRASGVEVFYRDQKDKKFAEATLAALVKATGLKSRGVKAENQSQHNRLAIFEFDGPACLAEIGFLDNPKDRQKLLSRECRVAFATEMYEYLLGAL